VLKFEGPHSLAELSKCGGKTVCQVNYMVSGTRGLKILPVLSVRLKGSFLHQKLPPVMFLESNTPRSLQYGPVLT